MPGGKHENMQAWSPEEDTIILEMHSQLGPMWSKIVRRLPGRTVSSVRNRWQRIEKGRKQREAGVVSKNRCHACGQPKRGHVCLAKLGGGPNIAMGPPSVTITNQLGVYVPVRSAPVTRCLAPPTQPTHSSSAPPLSAPVTFSLAPPTQPTHPLLLCPSALDPRRVHPPAQTVMAPAGPPAIRRTRSNTSVENLQELLRDSTQPVAQAAPEAAVPQPPMVRNNLSMLNMSFFEELGQTTERSDDETRRLLGKLAAESEGRSEGPVMPPALKRLVSGEAMAPPKMTRSNSAYLREMAQASSSSSSITALPPPPIGVPPGLAPPMVGGRRSSELLQEGLSLFEGGQLPNFSFSGVRAPALRTRPAHPPCAPALRPAPPRTPRPLVQISFGEGGPSRAEPPLALPSNLGQDFWGGAVAGHKRPADVLLDAPPVSRRRSGRSPSPRDSPRP